MVLKFTIVLLGFEPLLKCLHLYILFLPQGLLVQERAYSRQGLDSNLGLLESALSKAFYAQICQFYFYHFMILSLTLAK